MVNSDVELYATAADGSGLRRLTSTSAAEEAMAWARTDQSSTRAVGGSWTMTAVSAGLGHPARG